MSVSSTVESKGCVECGQISPYRCPICRLPYCSVACCQSHKTKQCQKPQEEIEKSKNTQFSYLYPTEDTIDIDKLKLLDHNDELRILLKDSALRNMMSIINREPHPEKLLKMYMQDEAFTNFVNTILNVVEPDDLKSSNS